MGTLRDGRYTFEGWTNANRGNWCFAKDSQNGGEEVFVKEFVGLRHPPEYANFSDPNVQAKKKQFDSFVARMRKVTEKVNTLAGPTGSLVVTIDLFVEKGKLFKVNKKEAFMPWEGPEVHEHMTTAEIDKLMKGIASAVGTLHTANILHCDLKPDNIFIVDRSGILRALVSDFDDSFFLDDIPKPDEVINTPPYLSPELVAYRSELNDEGPAQLTIASDMFTLGLIYYEYLAGEMIYGSQTLTVKNTGDATTEEGVDLGTLLAFDQIKGQTEDGSEFEYSYSIYPFSEKIDIPHKMTILKLLRKHRQDRIKNCAELTAEINRYSSLQKQKTYISLKNGSTPIANEEVKLYTSYISAVPGIGTVKELLLEARTNANGKIELSTGLEKDETYLVEVKGKQYPIHWKESADRSELSFELQLATNPVIHVVRNGSPAINIPAEIYQKSGSNLTALFRGKTDAHGTIMLQESASTEGCTAICDNYSYPVVFGKDRSATILLKPQRSGSYNICFRRGGQPAANQAFSLSAVIGGRENTKPVTANNNGVFSLQNCPLFSNGLPVQWSVSVDGTKYAVNWSQNQNAVIDLPQAGTKVWMQLSDTDTQGNVAHIGITLVGVKDGKPFAAGQGVSDTNGLVFLGAVEAGSYRAIVSEVPEAYADMYKKFLTINVPKSDQPLKYRFGMKRSDTVLDQSFNPPREGFVRLVIRKNGMCELTGTNGKVTTTKRSNLKIFGFDEYVNQP